MAQPEMISLHTIQRGHPKTGALQEIAPGTRFTPADEAEKDHLLASKAAKLYKAEDTTPPSADDDSATETKPKSTGKKASGTKSTGKKAEPKKTEGEGDGAGEGEGGKTADATAGLA